MSPRRWESVGRWKRMVLVHLLVLVVSIVITMITLMLVEMLLVDESFCDFVLIARGCDRGDISKPLNFAQRSENSEARTKSGNCEVVVN